MSMETLEWLNTYTLQSRQVWHTRPDLQEKLETVYDGAIPVKDVRKRLFGWEAIEAEIIAKATVLSSDGVEEIEMAAPDRKAILRPPGALGPDDKGELLGVFMQSYRMHQYALWLLDEVATILDDELGIFSAGLLRGGAQAFVQVTVPDEIDTPEGVRFRPNLLCVTSFDGSLATAYKRTVTNMVCDNTMSAALREDGEEYRVRHSRHSQVRLMDARAALNMVHTISDDFAAEVAELTSVKVSEPNWVAFLDVVAPLKKGSEAKKGRALTSAINRRAELSMLYNHDPMVAPWKGTAFGVVQAVNTHVHHIAPVRGTGREERNMTRAVAGRFDTLDARTKKTILALV